MKKLSSAQIRQAFLDFFVSKGHTVVPSASLVPTGDPTLLFTNAGMNQFKDVFLGVGTRPYTRAVDTQKVMRVSGKHNDLEQVGRDTYHHTFFEMLGNWSFGDYYKKEAIAWAWELLTGVWGLPKERLYATVLRDESGQLETDEEAAGYWRSETDIDPAHVIYLGPKDNFWEMGETGPCGPCSEIHYDRGPEACAQRDEPGHVCEVGGDCGRYVELWNLVFIQYNRDERGHLTPLPRKHIDTGAGFERVCTVLQGVDSNYETDLFTPIMDRIQQLAGHTAAEREEHLIAYRVIADHGRGVTFLIGDGVLPGNEGRNYVLRMVLRRAARFGRKIGLRQPFLGEIAKSVIDIMGHHFTELQARREFILTTIAQEEKRFARTLDQGLDRLDEILDEARRDGQAVLSGEAAFRLYDTFGLPFEITRDVAEERGFGVDEPGYYAAMQQQRDRARRSEQFAAGDEAPSRALAELLADLKARTVLESDGVAYDPYSVTELETEVVALLREGRPVRSAAEGDRVDVVLRETCFYVESGGQVSDTGYITAYPPAGASGEDVEPLWEIEVTGVSQPLPGLIVHSGTVVEGQPRVGDEAWALVDYERRMDIARNHTVTHLLHSELRYILGEHVQQAGSLVEPDRVRFDFTHPTMLTQEEIEAVTRSVNDAILVNYPVEVHVEPYREAIKSGAIALFGEKYSDTVRVIRIGLPSEPFSQEFCGGTHVRETGEIGLFHIVSEQGIGSGVRRIEAVTGRGAVELLEQQLGVLQAVATQLMVPPEEVERKVVSLLDELQTARREIAHLRQDLARRDFDALLRQVRQVDGVSLLAAEVEVASVETLREMTDWFRSQLGSGVIVLAAVLNGRPNFVAAVTPDLVNRGMNANQIVKRIGSIVGGGGGGKPTLAQAGGRDSSRIGEALEAVASLVREWMEG